MRPIQIIIATILSVAVLNSFATPDKTQLAVWANEAIVATYTFDHEHFLEQQKGIAKYYTAKGWIAYSNALNDSGLPEKIKTNAYFASSVATWPPTLTALDSNHWKAVMPLLVVYKNPQSQQKQNLEVVITFEEAPKGQGVRGLAITSINSNISEPPCLCADKKTSAG
jgi:hypothetical protein